MKKKHSLIYIAAAITFWGIQSCSKKIDEAYTNPNANVVQPIEKLFPNLIANITINNTAQGTGYGLQNDGQYVGRFVQFWATNTAGNRNDQMGDFYGTSTPDNMGSLWAMHYYGMGQNLNRVVEWGTEQKKWDYVGAAQVLRAWSWLMLTDYHGEVILKDAFNTSKLVFSYQEQKEVYDEVRRLCFEGIANLSKTGDSVSQTNFAIGDQYFYNGDVNKWKKFAYSIIARSYHRVTNKAEYKPDSVVKYCNLGIIDNADNASVKFAAATTVQMSYYGPSRGNIGTFRQTKFVADLFSGLNSTFSGVEDPREWYKIRENANGTFKGIRPNKGIGDITVPADQPQNFWGGAATSTTGVNANARYVFKDAMPWPVLTASEVLFMKSEALYRQNLKPQALDAYKSGIGLDFDMLTTTYNSAIPVGKEITPATKAAFLSNPVIVPSVTNFTLSHIMLQKYIALYGYGMFETWVDMRRYHYTDIENGTSRQVYADFSLPSGTDLFPNNNGKPIYRARPRYNSEYLYNIDALRTIGAFDNDYITKELWFSKP